MREPGEPGSPCGSARCSPLYAQTPASLVPTQVSAVPGRARIWRAPPCPSVWSTPALWKDRSAGWFPGSLPIVCKPQALLGGPACQCCRQPAPGSLLASAFPGPIWVWVSVGHRPWLAWPPAPSTQVWAGDSGSPAGICLAPRCSSSQSCLPWLPRTPALAEPDS